MADSLVSSAARKLPLRMRPDLSADTVLANMARMILLYVVAVSTLFSESQANELPASDSRTVQSQAADSATTESATIDLILQSHWREKRIEPAEMCDDATFLRRVTLDLAGRIPTTDELDAFLADPNRETKIDQLLKHSDFSQQMATTLTSSLIGYTRQTAADREVLQQWLFDRIERHTGFDEISKSLIASSGQTAVNGPVNFVVRHREDAAAEVCRQFLGVRLDCARCHDHPFARWTQEDLASMTRFFQPVRLEEISDGNVRVSDRPGRAESNEAPTFLTGAQAQTSRWRNELALFVTRSKPFARNFANRVWYQLLGRGIVDPPGDLSAQNQPSSPQLLGYLADRAREHRFRLRPLVREICNSKVYQLQSTAMSSASSDDHLEETKLFARRVIKPLTVEQLYDSYRVVLSERPPISKQKFVRKFLGETIDQDFLLTWTSRETVQSLLESMAADVRFDKQVDSVESAYRRVLTRSPSKREKKLCDEQRLATVVFCLIQSNEFVFNH